jgi:hypothetical protein
MGSSSDRAILSISLEDRSKSTRYGSRKCQITFFPAKILPVIKKANKHRIVVRILVWNYRGSILTLKFVENKPLIGSHHGGRFDLLYF